MLLDRVRKFLTALPLAQEPMLVAVSGGPDSVALVLALAQLQSEGLSGQLVLVHLNHQLRGEESAADEAFVRALHERLQAAGREVQLCCRSVDVAAAAQQHRQSIESMARTLRYEWFAELAQKCSLRWVATGHTADDQAETVLLRLLRGTGIKGLAGIPARRPLCSGVEVIRPLLEATRAEVLVFLAENQEPCRQDSSNTDLRFTRNRIRHELLPLLIRDYNPALVSVLGRLAVQAASLQAQEEGRALDLLKCTEKPRAGALLIFDPQLLQQASRQQVRELFRLVWQRENWPQQDMGFREWDRLAAVAFGERMAVDLPGRIRARRKGKVIQVGMVAEDG